MPERTFAARLLARRALAIHCALARDDKSKIKMTKAKSWIPAFAGTTK
jgi:hypothetical protein